MNGVVIGKLNLNQTRIWQAGYSDEMDSRSRSQ
jgi:hypothetical protein